ncbi:MAG TPA: quinone oxidoreductase [Pirellulaceae bacterium]|jgi:NADPH2:quinone reductase
MPQVVRFSKTGGPDVLTLEEVAVGEPAAGQVRIRHSAIGVNFIDTYHRSGLYSLPLPSSLGSEAAGVIEAVGPGVTHVKTGDRVAYAGGPVGAYCEARVMPADRLIKLPDSITDQQAAAMMLKGMTVQYLIRRTHRVEAGEAVLWHAAAGGVGLIACQWLKALGARVIGTVGSEEKASLAKAHGCDHTIIYTKEDFAQRVQDITGGRGVPVVFDSVGKSTFEGSLNCLKPRGLMVSFGNASGAVPPVEPTLLMQKGSLYLTRPTLANYTATREELEATAGDLFDVVASGKVKIPVRHVYKLSDVQQVHRDLEARKTTGCVVMVP